MAKATTPAFKKGDKIRFKRHMLKKAPEFGWDSSICGKKDQVFTVDRSSVDDTYIKTPKSIGSWCIKTSEVELVEAAPAKVKATKPAAKKPEPKKATPKPKAAKKEAPAVDWKPEVGDRVKISEAGHKRYPYGHANPRGVVGSIIGFDFQGWIHVDFDNGVRNCYEKPKYLTLVEKGTGKRPDEAQDVAAPSAITLPSAVAAAKSALEDAVVARKAAEVALQAAKDAEEMAKQTLQHRWQDYQTATARQLGLA